MTENPSLVGINSLGESKTFPTPNESQEIRAFEEWFRDGEWNWLAKEGFGIGVEQGFLNLSSKYFSTYFIKKNYLELASL